MYAIRSYYDEEKNAIKLNLAAITRGVYMLNYERKLTDYISAEVGIGATDADYLYHFFYDDIDVIESKRGFAFEANVRYYPNGAEYLEGTYVAPYFRYRTHSIGFYKDNAVDYHDSNHKELAILIGNQSEYGNLLMDYFIGVGYKTSSMPDYREDSAYDEDGVYHYSNRIVSEESSNFMFIVGVRIGILL